MLHIKLLRRPLSKGDVFLSLHHSRESHIPLFLNRQSQGSLLSSQPVQSVQTVALVVGIQITLFVNVHRPDNQIKAKDLGKTERTKARCKMF